MQSGEPQAVPRDLQVSGDLRQTEIRAQLSTTDTLTSSSRADAQRAEAHRMSAQIIEAVRHASGASHLDLALHPEELGRLRMVFSTTDMGVTVLVQADRPETLDLLRRHMDLLHSDLKQLGFEDVNLDFSGSHERESLPESLRNTDEADQREDTGLRGPGAPPPRPASMQGPSDGGLDIRL